MKRRLLAGVLTFVMMLSLLPATAFATEVNGEDAGSETVVEQGYVPSGVKKNGDKYENIPSDIQYKITKEADGSHTLTFWSDSGNAAFPTFNTEQQVLASDGTVWNRASYKTDDATYPGGYVEDSDGTKHAVDENYKSSYMYCTSNVYHYSKLPWYGNREKITKVVFEESITAFGQYTVCHMPKLEEVVIKNENCQVGSNAIYFNKGQQTSSQLTIMLSSEAKLVKGAVANATSLRYQFTDVETYKETYADVFNGTNTEKAKAQEAWNAYQAFSDAAKQQLQADTIGETEITYYAKLMELANNGTINTYEVFASGDCPGSTTTHYELSSNDGNQTFVLRFYADEGSNGQMTDLIIDDANRGELHYGCAPWYQYGPKIVKVIYDESITRTGYLTAAHFYNCTRFEFLNPNVEVMNATIHYNDYIKADAVEVYTAAANMPASCIAYKYEEDSAKVTFSFKTVSDFEAANAAFFTATETPEKAAVEAVMSTVAAWTSAQRTQLERDLIPGTQQSYMARLNAYAKVHGMSEMDSSEIVTGVCPVTPGIHYELRAYNGGKTYALRFYADSSSDGKMADYIVTYENQAPFHSDPLAYEKLPWRNTSKYNITSCTFDQSITHAGQFVMANIKSCTLYKFENPTADVHKNAIYYNAANDVNTNGITIELYATASMNGGPGHSSNSADKVAQYVHFSYVEAKDFIAKYQELWKLSEGEASGKIDTIKAAQKELSALKQVIQDQLNTDKIPGTETTYAAKLTQLMAKLNLGGSCGENANYALTDNGDGTYTLRITGSGALKDYSTDSAPWTGYSDQIAKVTIGSGITKLTKGAFSGLTALTSVDVPESVTEIAEGAFPKTEFDLYGYSNHASGKYAEAHSNVQLKLKSLRILCMGNSHTGDYTQYLQNALNDMKAAGVETNITYTLSPSKGGRMLYYWKTKGVADDRGSHYQAANTEGADPDTYSKYQETFKKTWDLIVVQDFHESTINTNAAYPGGAGYAPAMQEVVKWLNREAPGAKIAWFADWAEKASNSGDLNVSYANSVAAMNAIAALQENKPDYIIPASTVLQNARTSYLGTVHNPSNVLLNNKKSNGEYVFTDCAVDNMQAYTVLERDATHMSLELGRQLMATAFVYNLLQDYGQQIITPKGFDLFAALKTQPKYKDGNCYWLGEMTADNWAIIKEACVNAYSASRTVTNSNHTTDPFDAKYEQVKKVIADVTLPESLSQNTLEAAFKSDAVVNALNDIDGISVTKDSISITYQAAVNGTSENPTGVDGKLMVKVDCHYGYTYPTEPALSKILKANMDPGAEAALKELKQTATNKLNSYMHDDSYAEANQTQVKAAKAKGIAAINAATSEGEVTAALLAAEGAIDKIPTLFETEVVPDANCVARGQIWTGGWNHEDGGSGGIEKNYYTLDYTNSTDKKDSTFTGVWWVIRNDGKGGYSLEFCKDPGTGYSFVIPDYNANHWLDTWHVHKSYNPLQYNKTPWFTEYGKKITSATIDSGITVGRFTLACFPNIQTYTIKDNVTLNADSIYFNPIETDVKVNFEGSAVLAKSAFSAYGVQNSYAYYVDVSGDMSQVNRGLVQCQHTQAAGCGERHRHIVLDLAVAAKEPGGRRRRLIADDVREVHVDLCFLNDRAEQAHRIEALKHLADMGKIAADVEKRHQLADRAHREHTRFGVLALMGLRVDHELIGKAVLCLEFGQKLHGSTHTGGEIFLVRYGQHDQVARQRLGRAADQLTVAAQQRHLDRAAALHVADTAAIEVRIRLQIISDFFREAGSSLFELNLQLVRAECQRAETVIILHCNHIVVVDEHDGSIPLAAHHGERGRAAEGVILDRLCANALRVLLPVRLVFEVRQEERFRLLFSGRIGDALCFHIRVKDLFDLFTDPPQGELVPIIHSGLLSCGNGLKAGQWAGQAGGAAGTAVGNFFAFISEDLNASVFDLLFDVGAAGDQNALAGLERQQVGAEIVILFIIALDQLDAAGDEIFTEEHGHVLRIDDRLIRVDKTDDTHQVQAAVLALAVRHGNDDVLIDKAFGEFLELADALIVRAVATADGNGFLVDPKHVAALHLARGLNLA